MPNTTKMLWPFPAEDQDPWYETFASMVSAMDASAYAAREDRQLLLGGGGIISFDASSGLLTWSADFEIFSTISGFLLSIPAGSVTLADGQMAYTVVTRSPTQDLTLGFTVADTAPSTDGALVFVFRRGSAVYWRNGAKIDDGIPGDIFAGSAGGTDANAIHVNAGGEINGLTAKGTPVAADIVVIEDSADSFSKKKITLTDLLGGGGTLDDAYGAAGAGRTIDVDGPGVLFNNSNDNANDVFFVTKSPPSGVRAGDGISVFLDTDATGDSIYIAHDGTGGYAIDIDQSAAAGGGILVLVAGGSNPGITVDNTAGSGASAVFDGGAGVQLSPVLHLTSEAAAVPGGVPAAGEGKLWVRNDIPNVLVFTDDAGSDTVLGAGGGGNTLDGAYDQGGAGVGRAITADSGAVTVTSSAADTNNVVEVTKSPAGAQAGIGVLVTMGANTTGAGLSVAQSGTGAAAILAGGSGVQLSPVIHITSEASAVPGGAPSAGQGKLWVRDDIPNVLVFTDDAGSDTVLGAGGGGNTLDGAYDQGGAGVGRAITADAGAVTVTNSAADTNNVVEVTKSPAGSQAGIGVLVTMGANTTGAGLSVAQSGTGAAAILAGGAGVQVSPVVHFTSEAASVPGGSPSAGQGKLWVRSDAPNVVVYTDDTGVDTVLGSGVAEALATTGADVDVAAAAPPEVGQVLKATSATTATWQSPQALSSAQGDYMLAQLAADQSAGLLVGDPVRFASVFNSRGSIALDAGTYQFTLKVGRTYFLNAYVRRVGTRINFAWYDVTNGAPLGSDGEGSSSASNSNAVATVTPTTDILVEVQITDVSAVTSLDAEVTAGYPSTYASIIEIGAVQANVIGGLEFVDEIVVASPGQDFSFGAAGDGLFQRALDGDVDDEYVIIGDVVKGTDTLQDISIEPNALTTNQLSTRYRFIDASSTINISQDAYLTAANTGTSFGIGTVIHFEATLRAKTGQGRGFFSSFGADDGTNTLAGHSGGSWDESATVITSLGIHSEDAGGIDAGSRFCLYRRTRNNVRADSANTAREVRRISVADGDAGPTAYNLSQTAFGGSVVGISLLTDAAVTAGTLTAEVKVGGVSMGSLALSTTYPTGRRATYAIGLNTFGGNEAITVEITTAGSFVAGGPTEVAVAVELQNAALFQGPAGGKQHIKTYRIENTTPTTVTFSDLDGDVDEIYVLEWDIITAAGTVATLQPNALATNQGSVRLAGGTETDYATLSILNTSAERASGSVQFRARTTRRRTYISTAMIASSPYAAANVTAQFYTGIWNETSTNITSLVIDSTNALLAGSEFRLYRLTETAGAVEEL